MDYFFTVSDLATNPVVAVEVLQSISSCSLVFLLQNQTNLILGASNVLTIAGLAIGAAGSATTIGSKVTETAIEYKRKKQLEELLTVDATTGAVVNESFEGIRFKCECLTELMPSACKTWMESDWEPILNNMLDFELLTVATVDILKRIMTLKTTSANESTDSDEMLKIMGIESKGALKGSKKGFILGLGISAIAIIGDTVVMGYAIHQLRNGSESECVKKLRQIVEQLETCLDEFESGCSHLLKDELKTIE